MAGRRAGEEAGSSSRRPRPERRRWANFQRAISAWQPAGRRRRRRRPRDAAGQLTRRTTSRRSSTRTSTLADIARVLPNTRRAAARPRPPPARPSRPTSLAAANAFRRAVSGALGPAAEGLAAARRGRGRRDAQAVQGPSPRTRACATTRRRSGCSSEVEDHGAHLIRDAIRPHLSRSASQVVWGKLYACCLGKFPFINDAPAPGRARSSSRRARPTRARARRARRPTASTCPTIGMADISGAIAEIGGLSRRVRARPDLRGRRPGVRLRRRAPLDPGRRAGRGSGSSSAPPRTPGPGRGPPTRAQDRDPLRRARRPPGRGLHRRPRGPGDALRRHESFGRRPTSRRAARRRPTCGGSPSADSPSAIIGEKRGRGARLDRHARHHRRAAQALLLRPARERGSPPGQDDQVWNIRVELPDAERPNRGCRASSSSSSTIRCRA